jgi:hypothetical protein
MDGFPLITPLHGGNSLPVSSLPSQLPNRQRNTLPGNATDSFQALSQATAHDPHGTDTTPQDQNPGAQALSPAPPQAALPIPPLSAALFHSQVSAPLIVSPFFSVSMNLCQYQFSKNPLLLIYKYMIDISIITRQEIYEFQKLLL